MENLGPTAYEAAYFKYCELGQQIKVLQEQRAQAFARVEKYRGSSILESERIATEAEPFQATRLSIDPVPTMSRICEMQKSGRLNSKYVIKDNSGLVRYLVSANENCRMWDIRMEGAMRFSSATEANLFAINNGVSEYEVVLVKE